jgi:signal transduction histidine kinase
VVRRVAWRITVQTAALFMVGVVLLAAIAALLVIRAQAADDARTLRQAIADVDAVSDPPSGIVVYETDAGGSRSSETLHGRPLDAAAVDRVVAGGPTSTGTAHANGREYRVRTGRRGTTVVQAGLDLSAQEAQRHRLIDSLIAVGIGGLLLALIVGRVIALRAIRPLGDAIERQQRFIADASHELRTPLTQAHTRAQMIHRSIREDDRPELAADAARLVRSTRQMSEIVDELLASAQLRAQPEHVEPVDLGAIAREVVDGEQARASAQKVELTVGSDEGPHTVPGSATALRRVLNSLVDNALGHTPSGGHIAVEITRAVGPDQVVCAVRDDGTGFEATTAHSMFDRFARGTHGSSGRRYGLGLALVREVIDAHHGTISAAGAPGRGATFTVALPALPIDRAV